jgi:hypothetical protein
MEREPPLVAVLPRQPGTKESRYAHLLSGPVESIAFTAAEPALKSESTDSEDRIAQLEATVAELRREVEELRQKVENLFG